MKVTLLTEDRANKIYDVLVDLAGANSRPSDRADFIWAHCTCEYGCMEYRFDGHFGFGGKYRSQRNGISYYSETETNEMVRLKPIVENALQAI